MSGKISSLDKGYESGMLSLFPDTIDDKISLYEVKNNGVTTLKQSLPFNGRNIIVQNTESFPSQGLIRVGPPPGKPGVAELIYYGEKTNNVFKDLTRGFAGSIQSSWPAGANVTNAVMADPHNAVKDAILNIENTVGLLNQPDSASMHGILKSLEVKHLSPKPLFRAFPAVGPPPLKVRFQNFSNHDAIRFLWEFGDGGTSVERSPTYTFQTEGIFSVTLSIITSAGAQGFATKTNYITVDSEKKPSFFYVTLVDSNLPAYSVETAEALVSSGQNPSAVPAEFLFVDQTDGDIQQRIWVFGDGEGETITDPNIHTVTHIFEEPGEYSPSLLAVFASEQLKRIFLQDEITVL